MINAHLDVLELELRKLDGVRTVGFSSQHDVLYIQLFVEAHAPTAALPFEATRIAQRHSSSPVAVELVRWTDVNADKEAHNPLDAFFAGSSPAPATPKEPARAGSIGAPGYESTPVQAPVIEEAPLVEEMYDDIEAYDDEPHIDHVDLIDEENDDVVAQSHDAEVHEEQVDRRDPESSEDRIILLTVSTSSENDEIEVHLAFNDMRTIGRAPSNRGLLGAIDATVQAIEELTGPHDFHAEWARSLEPGAEHASLVAVGLTNSEGNDTRHGIAGGSSPIDAAARATLNALNRVAALAHAE